MKLPKFYNPFKPHIVQFADGKFAVRRWSVFLWEYKEHSAFRSDAAYWWNTAECVRKWCCVDTHEEAAILRDKDRIKTNKVVKVYG